MLAALGYAALAVADTVLASKEGKGARTARFVTKPLLMPVLATAFVGSTEGGGRTLGQGTAVAQAFSWGGDVALLGKGDNAFLAGLSSFFAGHLGYVAAFASGPNCRDCSTPRRRDHHRACICIPTSSRRRPGYSESRRCPP